MKITKELGQKIIKQISGYTEVDVNIMNLNGKIVASTDRYRINGIHTGAIHVIKTGNALTLEGMMTDQYPGTKPGMNFPIMHQRKMAGVVGVSGSPQEITLVSGLIRAFVEIILDQIHIQQQTYYKERRWNFWLQKLLHPSGFNEKELEEEAVYSFNIRTDEEWRTVILQGKDVQNELDYVRQEINNMKIKMLFMLPFTDKEIVIVFPSQFNRITDLVNRFSSLLSVTFRAGVGSVGYGLVGIRTSYQQAKQALAFEKSNTIISFSDNWKIKRLITSLSKEEYNRICLPYEQLIKDLGEEYVHTIDTFLKSNLSVKQTADDLHIHRNTLRYRFKQIKEKTGLDPRTFNDVFILKVIREWEG